MLKPYGEEQEDLSRQVKAARDSYYSPAKEAERALYKAEHPYHIECRVPYDFGIYKHAHMRRMAILQAQDTLNWYRLLDAQDKPDSKQS